MKAMLGVGAALMLLLGLSWLCFPQGALRSWGLQPDSAVVFVARRYGALCLGFAVTLWLGRASERSAILAGFSVANLAMAVVSTAGILSRTVEPAAWSAAALEALLAAAAGYFWLRGR